MPKKYKTAGPSKSYLMRRLERRVCLLFKGLFEISRIANSLASPDPRFAGSPSPSQAIAREIAPGYRVSTAVDMIPKRFLVQVLEWLEAEH